MSKVFGFDKRFIIGFISKKTGLSVGTVHVIVTGDSAMWKVCVKQLPKVLGEKEKVSRKKFWAASRKMKIFSRTLCSDETWVF